jgi:hypothetical protein
MKKSDRIKRESERILAKLDFVARHVRNVEDNTLLLGKKLIERGDLALGIKLIANGQIHDASKFHGIEFEYLSLNNPAEENRQLKLKLAVQHHRMTNAHHVEYWSRGIKEMPDVYLAELCCDVKARSEEFGTSLRDWIDTDGIKQWGIAKDSAEYKKIMRFVTLLCEEPFQEIK